MFPNAYFTPAYFNPSYWERRPSVVPPVPPATAGGTRGGMILFTLEGTGAGLPEEELLLFLAAMDDGGIL